MQLSRLLKDLRFVLLDWLGSGSYLEKKSIPLTVCPLCSRLVHLGLCVNGGFHSIVASILLSRIWYFCFTSFYMWPKSNHQLYIGSTYSLLSGSYHILSGISEQVIDLSPVTSNHSLSQNYFIFHWKLGVHIFMNKPWWRAMIYKPWSNNVLTWASLNMHDCVGLLVHCKQTL